MQFDFKNAVPPELKPLAKSYTADDAEKELKQLFLDLFQQKLAETAYDVNVTGAAHLGSLEAVRKSVNWDGLALLSGQEENEEPAMRYLYRAWQSRDVQGRGMHFLRTYLQLILPNLCKVEQMWQDKDKPYPHGLHSRLDEDVVIDPETMYLTSRLQIALDLTVSTRSITKLTNIFRSILPARLIPQFLFWIIFDVELHYGVSTQLLMQKLSEAKFMWCGRYVTTNPRRKWRLGKNDAKYPPTLRRCYVTMTVSGYLETEVQVLPSVLLISNVPEHIWNLGYNDDPQPPKLYWTRVNVYFIRNLSAEAQLPLPEIEVAFTKL